MTKTELRKKTNALITEAASLCREKMEKAILSGCMDIKNAEDNYLLPKALVTALLQEAARRYEPPKSIKKGKLLVEKIYRNI